MELGEGATRSGPKINNPRGSESQISNCRLRDEVSMELGFGRVDEKTGVKRTYTPASKGHEVGPIQTGAKRSR